MVPDQPGFCWLNDQKDYEVFVVLPKKIKLVKSSWACPFPYQRIMVMWDGAITACYNDFYGKLAMGNIHSTTLRDCWISSLENLRKLHRDGRADEIEACAKCPLRMNELRRRGEA